MYHQIDKVNYMVTAISALFPSIKKGENMSALPYPSPFEYLQVSPLCIDYMRHSLGREEALLHHHDE